MADEVSEIPVPIEAYHDPQDDDAPPTRTPEQWDGWDADREEPKTIAEAAEALARRIDDPRAPDDLSVYAIYDGTEDDA